MTGFGSALRRLHRGGWEEAYFRYGSLKLLLTQIETIYEESDNAAAHDLEWMVGLSEKKNNIMESQMQLDYRDQMFAMDDSDDAFASESSDEDNYSCCEAAFERNNLFAEDTEDNEIKMFQEDSDRVQLSGAAGAHSSFFLGNDLLYSHDQGLVFTPPRGEQMSLLPSSKSRQRKVSTQTNNQHSYQPWKRYSKRHDKTPERHYVSSPYESFGHRVTTTAAFSDNHRHRRSHFKRRKRRACFRWKCHTNVTPVHLRRAHAKASNLTEKFLGLLHAEVEKVKLFTYARLGELSDTIGSLRFAEQDHNPTSDFAENEYQFISGGSVNGASSSSSSEESAANDAPCFSEEEKDKRQYSPQNPPSPATNEKRKRKKATLIGRKKKWNRPVFQRSEQVIGEDSLLLAAEDELDAYTAVGVELLHLIRFISVNSISIRRIVKKHDKLLSNRMLGGYYHKMKTKQRESIKSLSSAIDVIMNRNNNKLLGVLDKQIQDLANCSVVQTISSSMISALSEFQTSQSRAEALARLRTSSHHDAFSTASNTSLRRLQYVVYCVLKFRECASHHDVAYYNYLSRCLMTYTGTNDIGKGLEGHSREALDLLQRTSDVYFFDTVSEKKLQWQDIELKNLSVLDRYLITDFDNDFPLQQEKVHGEDTDAEAMTLFINCLSLFLYEFNYYVFSPVLYFQLPLLGYHDYVSAFIIGVASVGAIIWACVQATCGSKSGESFLSYKSTLLVSALLPFLGNLIHIAALQHQSLFFMVIGRIFVGFGNSEIVNCTMVSQCVLEERIAKESARLYRFRSFGFILSPVIGSLLSREIQAFPSFGAHLSFCLCSLWAVQFAAVAFFFREPRRLRRYVGGRRRRVAAYQETQTSEDNRNGCDSDGDACFFDDINSRKNLPISQHVSSEVVNDIKFRFPNPLEDPYVVTDRGTIELEGRPSFFAQWSRVRMLLCQNIALPVAITNADFGALEFYPCSNAPAAFAQLTKEEIINSCVSITNQRFDWNVVRIGCFLSTLFFAMIPAQIVACYFLRFMDERSLVKNSIKAACLGMFCILNYESLLSSIGITALFSSSLPMSTNVSVATSRDRLYDGSLGVSQYVIGSSIIFLSMTVLEGASLQLVSKASPFKLNYAIANISLISAIIGNLGRILGDTMVTLIGVYCSRVNSSIDMVNALFVPLIVLCFLYSYIVRRHYFFLLV